MSLYASFKKGSIFAILSPCFVSASAHWDKDRKQYVRCLKPGKCYYCERKFQVAERFAAWVWDYAEEDDSRKIKVFTNGSAAMNSMFYMVAKEVGLQGVDFKCDMHTSSKGKASLFVEPIKGSAPYWFINYADHVKKLWLEYKNRDLAEFLGKTLTYEQQIAELTGKKVAFVNTKNAPGNFLSEDSPKNTSSQPKGSAAGPVTSNKTGAGLTHGKSIASSGVPGKQGGPQQGAEGTENKFFGGNIPSEVM